MTTLTIKINERTKAGKAFMAMAETFFKDAKGIEIISSQNSTSKTITDKFTLLEQIDLGLKQVKEAKDKKLKRKTLTELLNEK